MGGVQIWRPVDQSGVLELGHGSISFSVIGNDLENFVFGGCLQINYTTVGQNLAIGRPAAKII
jgi:hypothetical protein